MFPAIFRVFLDTNVLYPPAVRDLLLRAAEAGLIQVYWSEQVLEELRRNLVPARVTKAQAEKLLTAMRVAFPAATVRGYEPLVRAMRNHPGDRHVTAAALAARAKVIVTNNAKHFLKRDLPPGMEAQTADAFLRKLFALEPHLMLMALRRQAAAKRAPPVSLDRHLDGLTRTLPGLAADVRGYLLARQEPDESDA